MRQHFTSAVCCMLASILVAIALAEAPAGSIEVLNQNTTWRYHGAWRTPATIAADGKRDLGAGHDTTNVIRWIKNDFSEPTPPPIGKWTAPDYDDLGWSTRSGGIFAGYGYGHATDLYLICARARFGVADPSKAQGLKLNLTYRGGVIVYLNGAEIGRSHMRAGNVEPTTLAEDYPADIFNGPDGAPLAAFEPNSRSTMPAKNAEQYNKRFRAYSLEIPAKALVQGANVLAVEVHRSAIPAGLAKAGAWGTCGLNSAVLLAPADSGVQANVAARKGVLIWNCDTMVRAGTDIVAPDAFAALKPVALWAPRNGVANAQVVVSGLPAPATITATVTDLKSDKGASIPAACVQIRYVVPAVDYPKLLEKPQTATTQPIWLTARLPKDAAAGVYKGTLALSGFEELAAVPVELTVIDWTVCDRKDFHTSASLLQCPEAVAGYYKVPVWSDKHFEYLEKSFQMLGYAGNTLLSMAAISKDLFGDHPAIVFTQNGDDWMPDFRYAKRYLQTYDKAAGAPRQLSIQIWNYSISARGHGRDGGKEKWMVDKLKVWQLDGDKLKPAEMPIYAKPGTEKTWKAVAEGLRQIMKELGWDKTHLLWGTGGDNLPNDEIVAFFKQIDPKIYWRVATHGSSVSKWGATPEARTQNGGLILGYANMVRRNVTKRELFDDCPYDVIKRDGVSTPPMEYLTLPPLGRLAARYSGFGFLPFDYWTYTTPEGSQRNPLCGYGVTFGNITPHFPRAFVMPGPDGPAATPQLEAMREGFQVTEAALFLRKTIADEQAAAKLRKGFADEAKAAVQAMTDVMESNRRVHPSGTADVRALMRRVYELAAEVK